MTTYLEKSCSFGLPQVPFVNCRQFVYLVIVGRMWDLIISVPDHCLSFYFSLLKVTNGSQYPFGIFRLYIGSLLL